jgi:hypothetical protein
MSSYQIINSGKNQRRRYLTINNSPLFQTLPQRDFAHEQKSSYHDFLHKRLNELLKFYFPVVFDDHNNIIKINIENLRHQNQRHPDYGHEISEEEARSDYRT